ncbi:hypothetical protein KIN20_011410, partial [Parelaphostrongylus tenuis]
TALVASSCSLLLSLVEQHTVPVYEVGKATERAFLPKPAIEVVGHFFGILRRSFQAGAQHSGDHRLCTMTARHRLQIHMIAKRGLKVVGYILPTRASASRPTKRDQTRFIF